MNVRIPLVFLVAFLSATAGHSQQLEAFLLGLTEVSGGDPNGVGRASLNFDGSRSVIQADLSAANLSTINGAHIHRGAAGVDGPIVLDLMGGDAFDGSGNLSVQRTLPPPLALELLMNPGSFYVNIHTTEFGAGAIRGQLVFVPRPWKAALTGAAEGGDGDPDGSGRAFCIINSTRTAMLVDVNVQNIGADGEITGAHIHQGARGVDGPIVVTLPNAWSAGQLSVPVVVSGAIADAISASPSDFYVNVHTSAFPDGAIRGQLSPPVQPLRASLTGTAEVPNDGDLDGVGKAAVAFGPDRTRAYFAISVENLGTITGTHIHRGAAGVNGPVVLDILSSGSFVNGRLVVARTANPDLVAELLSHPDRFYVNVHTSEFGAGAIRGQLTPVFSRSGDPNGDGEVNVPDVFTLLEFLFADGPEPE